MSLFKGALCPSETLGMVGIVQSNWSVFVTPILVSLHFTKCRAHLPGAGDYGILPECDPRPPAEARCWSCVPRVTPGTGPRTPHTVSSAPLC